MKEMLCLGHVCPPSGVVRREAGAIPQTPNKWNFYVSIIYKNTKFIAIRCVFYQAKNAPKPFSAGAPPRTPLGELTTLSQTP